MLSAIKNFYKEGKHAISFYMWKWVVATVFIFSFIMGISIITIPFTLSLAGFWPAVIAALLSWVYLLFTGFYYLETILANPAGANVFSFSLRYTGLGGAWFASGLFLIVQLSSLISLFYVAGPFIAELLYRLGFAVSTQAVLVGLVIILGGSVALGLAFTMVFNLLLTLPSLFLLGLCFYQGFEPATLTRNNTFNWGFIFIVFPTLINSLYYNTFIPTIAPFLKYNRKKLQSAIITAMSLGALFLIAWIWLNSAGGLGKINPAALSFTNLHNVAHFGKWLPLLLSLHIGTTGLAESAVLVDLLFDCLHVPLEARRGGKRILLCFLIFLPPLFLNIMPKEWIYITTLYITEVGPLYLAGLFPILCAWSLRYFFLDKAPHLVPGGKPMMLILGIFSCFVFYFVGLEIFYQTIFR